MCYLNSDSITLWCCSGDAVQCQGVQNVSLALSHGHRFKGKAVTKQGEDRDSSCSSAGSVHICESVATESLKYFTIVHPVSYAELQHVSQGRENREITSMCNDSNHFLFADIKGQTKRFLYLSPHFPTSPVIEVPNWKQIPDL